MHYAAQPVAATKQQAASAAKEPCQENQKQHLCCAKRNRLRSAAVGLVVATILIGGAGLSCDQSAQADFRNTAAPAVASGVKTILGGLIDAVAASIQNAGKGSSTSSNSSTNSSSNSSTST